MVRARASLAALTGLSVVAAATTWVALLSWRGFTVQSGKFLGPLLVLAVVVAGSGTLARWWRMPGPVLVLIQVVLSGMVASAMICGSPLPVGAAWTRMVMAFTDAADSANRFAPPVPSGVPGVHPFLIAGGLGCLLLVDVLACTLRRVPLAGLPLLTIYSVPVSMLGTNLTWWVFGLTSAGFLGMLFLHESEQVARWGRPLGEDPSVADPQAFGVRTGAVRATAGAIGGVVTALAILVPLLIPTFDVHLVNFGPGAGGDKDIHIDNPMADLRRDLTRGEDIPLVEVRTKDPDPSYLRIAVLNRFLDNEWSSGDRDVPTSSVARGELPPLVGVNQTVLRQEFAYRLSARPEFRSTWLPTKANLSQIDAPGDWRYDPETRDFLASDDDLTTSGLTWTFTSVRLDLDADALARSGPSASLVPRELTRLPQGMNPLVRNLANEVTREEPTRFQKAVALQQWFRESGGFTYDDTVSPGNGTDDLVRFLSEGEGGRTGYCEQFAAAMAVMARELGIPARVAVGFLAPEKVGVDTYVYSAHDLHAWPELFFAGAGWVRFEPTPAGRATGTPDYTTDPVTVNNPSVDPSATQGEDDLPRPDSGAAVPRDEQTPDAAAAGSSGGGFPWPWVLGAVLLAAVAVVASVGPRAVRARRRERNRAAGAEEAWDELRDTALDLSLAWPRDRSPRQTRDALVRLFGSPVDEFTLERPRRGADTNPDAVQALDRIVRELERMRYARVEDSRPGTLRAEIQTCVEALYGGAPRRPRRLAAWWPRSVFTRPRPARRSVAGPAVTQATYGGVVDHVG